ncbi:outer membrane protein assembly factor [Palleronia caenipelagi]|uniref:Outer membrane protein assembly factor n=1 Tax=Palleronia caenipelagi TaxID=2489174 RepID=A0A547Q5P1_9RHOB|nr:outer membrane protein assembly factor [Palleronia caenipelagi]
MIAASLAVPALAFDGPVYDVEGSEDLLKDIKATSLVQSAANEDVADPAELLAAARADYGRLVGTLYSQGFYGGVVSIRVNGQEAAEISPLTRLGRIESIVIAVEPGRPYRFSRAQIGPLAEGTDLPDGYTSGEIAESKLIRDAAGAAIDGWRAVGHAKADVGGQEIVANHPQAQLSSEVQIAPGPLVRFGEIQFEGSDAVRPARLREIAGFPDGEVFSPEALDGVARRLRDTQVFSSAAVTEDETLGPNDTLDVTADLVAYKPRRIGFGAEVSTVEGLGLNGYWIHRNLFGGAERLQLDAEATGIGGGTGGVDFDLSARFERPATFSPENTFFTELSYERLDEDDFTSDVGFLEVGIQRYVNEHIEIQYGLAYRFSHVEDDSGTTDYSLLALPLSATYDDREEPLNAKSGYYLDLDLAPFLGTNDETGSGAWMTWDARTYRSFGTDDRFTLAGRLQGGSIVGADLDETPNDLRFYSGGGGTVRGQDYQSLDVTLDDGTDSGGASFVGVSLEGRFDVTPKIGVVGFYDYGIVGEDSFPDGDSDDHSGAGIGVRYATPIGPIRLDVAAPVSGGGNGFEVYLGIGQAF